MSEWTHKDGVDGIRKQAQELIEQAYQKGYKAGQKNALVVDSDEFREQGRNEAWEVAKKIVLGSSEGGLPGSVIDEYFDVPYYSNVFLKYSASEAIARIKSYEEQQMSKDFKVGDEVILNDGDKAVVTEHHSDVVCVVRHNGCTSFKSKDDIKKTGRIFPQIAEVLKKMQEGTE